MLPKSYILLDEFSNYSYRVQMVNVTSLAQHILQLEPDKDAARLCLYHYLKNLCEPSETVTAELMNRFYHRALTFPHWQENKIHLFGETTSILQHYLSKNPNEALDLGQILITEQIQVVKVDHLYNLEAMVSRFMETQISPLDQLRVVPEGDDKIVAIWLKSDRTVRVQVFPKIAAFINGQIWPLCMDYSLSYTPDLVLNPNVSQQIEVGPHTVARFRMTQEGCRGTIVRGYTFQKYSAMDGGSLHRYPILFYPLKRLEQFFINRKTDPMYIELTGLLEKSLELLTQRHPEALKFGTAALERGRLALEHIFPDDKLVRLLISNLEKTLALEAAQAGHATSQAAINSMYTGSEKSDLECETIRPLNV